MLREKNARCRARILASRPRALARAAVRRLERDVVVQVVELAAGLLRALRCARGGRLLRLAHLLARAGVAHALAAAEHLHAVGDDLGGGALLPLLVLPLARAEAPFDVDLRALLQVLARDLREPAEEHHAVPLGALLLLAARLVLPRVGGRHRDVADRPALGVVAGLGVAAQIAHQDDLVDRCHESSPSRPKISEYTVERAAPARCASAGPGRTRRYARRPPSPGARIPAATTSHNATSADPNTKTAGSPKRPARPPPTAAPTKSPSDWVVL